MASKDIYGKPSEYKVGNVFIRAYRPMLSKEEKEKRITVIANATADLLISLGEGGERR